MPAFSCLRRAFLALGLIVLFQLAAIVAPAQVPAWAWARNQVMTATAGTSSSLISPKRVAVDGRGNSYVFGRYSGILTLGAFTLSAVGGGLYVAKYDPAGTCLWAVSAGGPGAEEAQDLVVDPAGNVFVAGYFDDTVVFGPSTLSAGAALTERGAMFVGKLNPAGSWQWATQFGADVRRARATSVRLALAPDGDLLLGGAFNDLATRGTFPFNFGSIVLSTAASGNNLDLYAARLDPTGTTWRWAIRVGGSQVDGATAIASDAAGNAYLTGFFNGTVAFGSQSVTDTGGSGQDVFVAKLNPTGQWVWASSGGGNSPDAGTAIAADAAGNCVVAGRIVGSFGGTVTFGSTTLTLNPGVTSSGPDVLVAKLSSSGQWQWAARAGGRGEDAGTSVALDAGGRVFVAGYVSVRADFGPTVVNDAPASNPVVTGTRFLGLLSPAGTWQWVTLLGMGFGIEDTTVAHDGANAFITGAYLTQVAFDAITLSAAPSASNAGYLAKLGAVALAARPNRAAPAFSVAPNPLVGRREAVVRAASAGQLEIRDLLGREVVPRRVLSPAGEQHLHLPASLTPGLYLATLRTAAGAATQRLVVE